VSRIPARRREARAARARYPAEADDDARMLDGAVGVEQSRADRTDLWTLA